MVRHRHARTLLGRFKVHTGQGWNIGKPPYGYAADKGQHPVPAKAAEGQTKTRLVPDPQQAPVVAHIFRLRVVERLGYDAIAARLNTDPDRYPVPEPTSAHRRRGVWSGSAVRDVLYNPKYTGYMVWNRRATKSGGRVNPPSAWVWSDEPTHEPLIDRATFEAAAGVSRTTRGSRAEAGPNDVHRDTKRATSCARMSDVERATSGCSARPVTVGRTTTATQPTTTRTVSIATRPTTRRPSTSARTPSSRP